MDQLELRRRQLSIALISKLAQHGDRRGEIGIADEEVHVPKDAKTEIAIGLDREDGTLEWDGLDANLRQCLDHARKLTEQCKIRPARLIHNRAEGGENVVWRRI